MSFVPEPIRLSSPNIHPGGNFELFVGYVSGLPFTLGDITRIRILSASVVGSPSANWQQVSNPIVLLTNGVLRVDGLSISNSSSKFYRVEQIQ